MTTRDIANFDSNLPLVPRANHEASYTAVLEKYWYLPVFIIALPLYLINVGYGDLWNDEVFSKHLTTFSLPGMMDILAGDFHPPLYFVALKVFAAIAGSSAIAMRSFSVIAVFATLLLVCTMGKRVLGKSAAVFFCLIILTIPMVATYAHTVRMYTWAAFSVTGLFLCSCAMIRAPSNRDLLWLGLFTLLGAYLHYFCILAAFCANTCVLTHLVVNRNGLWRRHLVVAAGALVLYTPWLLTLLHQIGRVRADFFLPKPSALFVGLCYLLPFSHDYYPVAVSVPLALIFAALTIASAVAIFSSKQSASKPALLVSLVIFNGTIALAIAISLLVRPILLYRYAATIMTMLAVPPALYFAELRSRIVKASLFAVTFGLGIYASFDAGKNSLGAYQAAMTQVKRDHPDINKMIHILELTASPFVEYNYLGPWEQFWLANQDTVSYTNMKTFRDLKTVQSLQAAFREGERFILADLPTVPLNRKNFELVMKQCQTISVDTISDERVAIPAYRLKILLYQLQYRGEHGVGD
jgi:hypothetical protein